jgi:hypothetical protein
MTSLAFPQFPQLDETYTLGDRSWKWNGLGWEKLTEAVSKPYGIVAYSPGIPEPNDVLLPHIAAWAAEFPPDLVGSYAIAVVAATSQTDIAINVSGTQVGTMRFAAGSAVGTFLPGAAFSLAQGDVLTVVAPALADATLSDISFTLTGSRV